MILKHFNVKSVSVIETYAPQCFGHNIFFLGSVLHLVVVLYVVVLFKQIPIVVVGNPHSFLVSEYVHY